MKRHSGTKTTRGQRVSGAAGRLKRMMFADALVTGVRLGIFSPAFVEAIRKHGLTQDAVIGHVNVIRGFNRHSDEQRDVDDAEQQLAHLYTRLNANTSGARHRTKGAK